MSSGPALRARWSPALRARELAAGVPLDDRRAMAAQEVSAVKARLEAVESDSLAGKGSARPL